MNTLLNVGFSRGATLLLAPSHDRTSSAELAACRAAAAATPAARRPRRRTGARVLAVAARLLILIGAATFAAGSRLAAPTAAPRGPAPRHARAGHG